MKTQVTLSLFTITVLISTLQSCGLSSNNASSQPTTPVVTTDTGKYKAEVQQDTSNQLVSLTNYLQPLLCDWRYATADNFTGQVLYHNPVAYLRLPAAKALQAVQEELKTQNLSLLIYDAYRPYSVTKKMWAIVPDERYAAPPSRGSNHNRGVAVDVTLVNLQTREPLPMPTGYDDFTEKAHHDYMKLDSAQLHNRSLLKTVMEKHGFKALDTEWWHYALPDPKKYPLLDLDFDQLRKIIK